jgi:hypothetical protein
MLYEVSFESLIRPEKDFNECKNGVPTWNRLPTVTELLLKTEQMQRKSPTD